MPRQRSETARRIVYSLDPDLTDLTDALSPEADASYCEQQPLTIDDEPALLVFGEPPETVAKWCLDVQELTGVEVLVHARQLAAVVLMKIDSGVFAVTFGGGRRFLRKEAIVRRFGLRTTLRTINPMEITQLTRSVMDSRGQTDRSAVTGGQRVRDFGVEGFGEIVPKVVGRASGLPIQAAAEGKSVKVAGSDSIQIPLGRTGADLISDLTALVDYVSGRDLPDDLKFIESIEEVAPRDPTASRLWSRIEEAIRGDSDIPVALARPWRLDDYDEEITNYRLSLRLRMPMHVTDFDYADLAEAYREAGSPGVEWLRSRSILAINDEGSSVPHGRTTAEDWLVAECTEGSSRYFLRKDIGIGLAPATPKSWSTGLNKSYLGHSPYFYPRGLQEPRRSTTTQPERPASHSSC